MEWKIGEIKQIKGEWYQCVKGESEDKCTGCFFKSSPICIDLNCLGNERKDHTKVIFKKLEKVGEPFTGNVHIQLQRYKIYTKAIIDPTENISYINEENTIVIEIKQTKEDVEEKKQKLDKLVDDYIACRIQYAELDKEIKALYDKEESEPTLKEFDIQKAREGKPVCTRDGRKARIICFDTKGDPCPIIALVEENGIESAYHYDKNGQNAYNKSELDLMMLPEKKEGWVNVYKGGLLDTKSYNTKKEAFDKASPEDYVDTVKINWEE